MELTILCAVFMCAGYVSGIPHGYGVKGGAAAIAGSNAVAGAFSGFGGHPTAGSINGGFSGSYSKSSSSSFASSSASSSSSSFSFSGSGLPIGCPNGNCQNSATNDGVHNPKSYSNGDLNNDNSKNYNNAAASAQAASLAGAQSLGSAKPTCTGENCPQIERCNGATCDHKCESGKCHTSPSHDTIDNVNCASGKCSTSHQSGSTLNNKDNDDTKISCKTGQCNLSPINNIPSTITPTEIRDNRNETCKSGLCKPVSGNIKYPESDDISVNINNNYNIKPSTEEYKNIYDKKLDDVEAPISCSYGKCSTTIQPASKPAENSYTPEYNSGLPECSYPNCAGGISNSYKGHPDNTEKSAFNKPVNYLTTPKQEPSCPSSNCKPNNSNQELKPTGYVPLYPPYFSQQPPVSSDYFSPNKCVGGTCKDDHSDTPYTPSSQNLQPPNNKYAAHDITGSNCNSNNCQTSPQLFNQNPSTSFNPSSNPSTSSYNPNCAPGKCSSAPSPYMPKPINIGTTSTAYLNLGTPALPCSTPNCQQNVQTPINQNDYNSYQPELSNPINPALGTNHNSVASIGTNPNKSQYPSSSFGSNYSNNIYTTPSASGHKNTIEEPYPNFVPLNPCSSSNCAGNQPAKPSYNLNAETTLPNSGAISPSYLTPTSNTRPVSSIDTFNKPNNNNHEKPVYTGGFGGPSGFLKPNDYSLPLVPPVNAGKPNTATVSSTPCIGIYCNKPISTIQTGPGNVQGLQNPTSNIHSPCSSGSCGPHYDTSGTASLNSAAAAANANAVAYTGGFGGPPGFLTPYDNGKGGKALYSNNDHITGQQTNVKLDPLKSIHGIYNSNAKGSAGAQAFAVAGAKSGAFVGDNQHSSGHYEDNEPVRKGGCGGGCTLNSQYNDGSSSHASSGANAGALSGAGNSLNNFGRSFASSASVAHASSGAAVKGYGR